MKVIFAGTPDFAAAALVAIAEAGFEIPLVLTQPDRPKGRGMQLQASPVKQQALALGLRVEQPMSLRENADILAMLQQVQADVMVVAAYGLILPEWVLNMPKYGCLNIHASLLPRWRGAAPIQRAIEAGDEQTGVCIMQMDRGLDTGAVVSEHRYTIRTGDTAQTVHDALMQIGARAIVQDLKGLQFSGCLKSVPQAEVGVTYAAKLSKDEARINWQEPAVVVARKIRAFNPVPTAWTQWQGQSLKVWQAEVLDAQGQAGEILAVEPNRIVVACGDGAIGIQQLQLAGGKRMEVAAFLAGKKVLVGERLG